MIGETVSWKPNIQRGVAGVITARRIEWYGMQVQIDGKSWVSEGLLEMPDGELAALQELVALQVGLIAEAQEEARTLRGRTDEIARDLTTVLDACAPVLSLLTGSERPTIMDCGGDGPVYRLALVVDGFE